MKLRKGDRVKVWLGTGTVKGFHPRHGYVMLVMDTGRAGAGWEGTEWEGCWAIENDPEFFEKINKIALENK